MNNYHPHNYQPPHRPQPQQRRRVNSRKKKSEMYVARLILFAVFFLIILTASLVLFFITLRSGVGLRMKKSEFSATTEQSIAASLTAISEDVYYENQPDLGFVADLEDYEIYMNPANRDEYLVLINTKNPLANDYVPSDLVDVVDTRKDGRATQKMRLYAEKALEAMFIELRANGFDDVSVTSAYRSYAQQESNFNNRMASYSSMTREEAYAKTATIIAIPGTSEHQSGLCADLHNLSSALTIFAEEEAAKWLAANCHKFGFILRYPEDKTDITGIIFEPWHFRYVGRYHATKIMEAGLCLEEYFETLK